MLIYNGDIGDNNKQYDILSYLGVIGNCYVYISNNN